MRETLYKRAWEHLEAARSENKWEICFLRTETPDYYLVLTSLKACDWSGNIFGASPSPRSYKKNLAMSPSSTVHGGQHDTKYVTLELIFYAAFVAVKLCGDCLNQIVTGRPQRAAASTTKNYTLHDLHKTQLSCRTNLPSSLYRTDIKARVPAAHSTLFSLALSRKQAVQSWSQNKSILYSFRHTTYTRHITRHDTPTKIRHVSPHHTTPHHTSAFDLWQYSSCQRNIEMWTNKRSRERNIEIQFI